MDFFYNGISILEIYCFNYIGSSLSILNQFYQYLHSSLENLMKFLSFFNLFLFIFLTCNGACNEFGIGFEDLIHELLLSTKSEVKIFNVLACLILLLKFIIQIYFISLFYAPLNWCVHLSTRSRHNSL